MNSVRSRRIAWKIAASVRDCCIRSNGTFRVDGNLLRCGTTWNWCVRAIFILISYHLHEKCLLCWSSGPSNVSQIANENLPNYYYILCLMRRSKRRFLSTVHTWNDLFFSNHSFLTCSLWTRKLPTEKYLILNTAQRKQITDFVRFDTMSTAIHRQPLTLYTRWASP